MPEARIPAHLIIGATGAGKTTLVSRLLAQRQNNDRWAVLVNDFGATALNDETITVREVSGCICCSAHVALRVALVALLREARPHRLIIEASAAARPAAVRDVLAEPGLAAAVELRSTLCVVEPRQLTDGRYTSSDVYREQIAEADAIVLNAGADSAARATIESMRSAPTRYVEAATLLSIAL